MENLTSVSISELLAQFESDIRFDSHSTVARIRRSLSGQELQRRGDPEIVSALRERIESMSSIELDGVETSVRDGLDLLLLWIRNEPVQTVSHEGM